MSNPFYVKDGFFLIEKFFGIYLIMKLLFIDYTMDTQKIQITEAKNTLQALEVVNSPDKFLLLLDQHNITDLSDKTKIQIQKDGDRYVFSLFGNNMETKFSVAWYNAREFISKFLEKQKAADEHIAVQLTGLQLEIMRGKDERISSLNNQLSTHEQDATDPEVIKERIAALKDFFENQRDDGRRERFWISSKYSRSWQERQYRKIHKEEAEKRLKDLKNIEKSMKKVDKWLSTDFYLNEELTELELKNISQQLDNLSNNVPQFELQNQSLRNGNADITPNYEIDVTKLNKKQAERLLKAIKEYNEKQAKVTKITQQADQEQMRARDLSGLQKYLNDVLNNKIDPTIIPYVSQFKDDAEYLYKLDSSLQNDYPLLSVSEAATANQQQLNQGEDLTWANGNIDNKWQWKTSWQGIENKDNAENSESFDDAVRKWGLYGGIDYRTKDMQDQSPRWQQFYKSFGNIALLVGWGFLLWKSIKSTWNIIRGKWTGKDRGRVGASAGLLLLTAGRPQDLFKGGYASEKFADILNWIGIGGKKNNESASTGTSLETLPQAVTGASLLFGKETYGKIKDMVQLDSDGKMIIKPDVRDNQLAYYNDIISHPAGKTAEEVNQAKARKEFLERIGKNDKNRVIDLALRGVWLSWEELNKPENKDKAFNDQATNVIQRSLELGALMDSKWYDKTNGEVDDKILSFVQTGSPTLAELEEQGVFEKKVNIPADIKTKFDAQIDALTGLDDAQKKQLREALYQFYMDLPGQKPDIKLETKEGKLVLTTYNESTPIDISNNTIPGLYTKDGVNALTFPMKKELLRVANLTNYIKHITRNLTTTKEKPFYIEVGWAGLGKRLKFDNSKWYEVWKTDTAMISNDSLEKVSRQLINDDNKEAYATYLNNQKTWKGGENENSLFAIPVVVPGGNNEDSNSSNESEIDESDVNIIDQAELQKDLEQIDALDLSDAQKEKLKKDYKEFYQKYPTFKTIWVELIADGKILKVRSYNKETPIDFGKSQIAGLNIDMDNFEDLFKTANLTNKIRNTFWNINSKSLVDPFHQDPGFDITFDDKSIRDRRPDVAAVSDWLWRGGLKKTSPKLTETSNKQLYIQYLNNLRLMEDKANGFFLLRDNISNFDTTQKIIDWFKAFYKEHPSEEKDIKFEKNDQWICLVTYEQSTPIDLINKKVKGLSLQFDTYEELFKVANLINRIESITADKQTDKQYDPEDGPFDITWLGALEFYGKEKTVRINSENWDLIRGDDKWLRDVSEKFDERPNKYLLENYLNNRWATLHQTQTQPQQ